MTKITISLIISVLFVLTSLSTSLIPCTDSEGIRLCKLDGEQNYFGTEKLSDPLYAGIIIFVIIFLILFSLLSMIFKKPKYHY